MAPLAASPVVEVLGATQPPKLSGEHEVLARLFKAVDALLPIYASRRTQPAFGSVRKAVEETTGKVFSVERLGRVLALAGDMLEARWVGDGYNAVLELTQRAADGTPRPPNPKEQAERSARFDDASIEAWKSQTLPPSALPPAPARPSPPTRPAEREVPSQQLSPAPSMSTLRSSLQNSSGATATQQDRAAALLARVRARHAAAKSPAAVEEAEVRRSLQNVQHAITLHAVMKHLFARGDVRPSSLGEEAATSARESEAIAMASSRSYSAQCMSALDEASAKSGMEVLITHASGWFCVESARHMKNERLLRRLAVGDPNAAIAALQAERQRLDGRLSELVAVSRAGEASCASQASAAHGPSAPVPAPPRQPLTAPGSGATSAHGALAPQGPQRRTGADASAQAAPSRQPQAAQTRGAASAPSAPTLQGQRRAVSSNSTVQAPAPVEPRPALSATAKGAATARSAPAPRGRRREADDDAAMQAPIRQRLRSASKATAPIVPLLQPTRTRKSDAPSDAGAPSKRRRVAQKGGTRGR